MAYRQTETISAEAEANDAIDAAIEDAIADAQEERKREAVRSFLVRWTGRLVFLLGLATLGVAWLGEWDWLGLAGAILMMLAPGIGLMRLGGSLSAHAESDQAPINKHLLGR